MIDQNDAGTIAGFAASDRPVLDDDRPHCRPECGSLYRRGVFARSEVEIVAVSWMLPVCADRQLDWKVEDVFLSERRRCCLLQRDNYRAAEHGRVQVRDDGRAAPAPACLTLPADSARQAMDLAYRHGSSTSFRRDSRLAERWRDLQTVDQTVTLAPEWYPVGGSFYSGLDPHACVSRTPRCSSHSRAPPASSGG